MQIPADYRGCLEVRREDAAVQGKTFPYRGEATKNGCDDMQSGLSSYADRVVEAIAGHHLIL